MAILRKLGETLRLLRHGPERFDSIDARLVADQASAHARTHELVQLIATSQRRSGELDEYVRGVQAELHGLQTAVAVQIAELREQDAELNKQVADLREQVAMAVRALTGSGEDARREAEWTRNQISALGAALDRMQRPSDAPGTAVPAGIAAAEEGFYPTLEHYFRGSTEDLRERLGAYRRWIQDLPEGLVADLGCGRGEWLELLGEWGVEAVGVDLNAPNVEAMRARGLAVHHADALQWLQARPDASLAAITSFHVIEHLPFGVLLRLVQEARRVLVPGGRLIMETPNPENVIVATQTFWLDPTHVRPLPPALLEVVVRDSGLEIEALLRLNPPADGLDIADPTLRSLMTQGRDCAVVGRRPLGVTEAA